jgi:hypothetical protein
MPTTKRLIGLQLYCRCSRGSAHQAKNESEVNQFSSYWRVIALVVYTVIIYELAVSIAVSCLFKSAILKDLVLKTALGVLQNEAVSWLFSAFPEE